jgi:ACS family allantoate permease-like MFS transporter
VGISYFSPITSPTIRKILYVTPLLPLKNNNENNDTNDTTAAFNIIIWGLILACFAAVHNYSGALTIRFLLGVFEAAVTPGFALFTSQWYTLAEQGSRTAIWFSFNGFAQIFGGVVAYGIAVGCRVHGTSIEPWKIVFLVTGLLTACVGLLFLWIVPDNQLNCRWLSEEERVLAIERIRGNKQGVGNKHFKWYQLKEALGDPLSWAFFFYALVADVPNGKFLPLSFLPVLPFCSHGIKVVYQTSSPNSS